MTKTQELAVPETPAQSLKKKVAGEDFRKQVALALPGDVSADRFVRSAITALMANPDIATCEPDSIFNALLKAAQDGLLADGREAALVNFKGKAQYMPMVSGFRKVAAESGWSIKARCVYANDHFEYTEEPPLLVHNPVRPGAERGALIAAYAIGRKHGEDSVFKVMYRDEIEKRRAIAKTDNVWKGWTAEMYEKTAARSLFADLPLGDRERVRRVLEASDPSDAAALLYGNGARAALSSAPPADVEVIDLDSQQAGEAQAPAESAITGAGDASPAPDPAEEPELEPEPTTFAPPADVADRQKAAEAAAGFVVPNDWKAKGKRLSEIAAKPSGEQWFGVALRKSVPGDFRDAVVAYARVYLPDIFAAYEAEVTAAGGQEQLA